MFRFPVPTPTRSLSSRLAWLTVGITVTAGLVFAWGANRVPANTNSVLALHEPPQRASLTGPRFRIGSFNIRGGKNRANEFDLTRTVEALRKHHLDVIGLSEVHGHAWGELPNQAVELGEALDRSAVFVPTERRYWHDHFGNGVLTNVELGAIHWVPLPGTQGKKFRNAVLTNFQVGETTVHFLTVHLDRVKDRPHQLRQVITLFNSLKEPAILVGDLNTTADDPQLAALLARADVHDAVAEGLGDPVDRRIDWILTRGLKTIDADCIDEGASDHPLVWAEFEVLER
ncbi:endonuclease/exonuclease/phosphatase family protein [Thalassoroseus pseudoceratinae]|uniref:endonuclease/exonuclease/phosphatase family protein n=1 Tax=Thalassoroseus pseudoceratinae TaxID=2713176 RepID=UPI00141EE122|nr:endonuclease/exonuclease/phosphatase family protein [Thalassoroseus pseudoceratinae]